MIPGGQYQRDDLLGKFTAEPLQDEQLAVARAFVTAADHRWAIRYHETGHGSISLEMVLLNEQVQVRITGAGKLSRVRFERRTRTGDGPNDTRYEYQTLAINEPHRWRADSTLTHQDSEPSRDYWGDYTVNWIETRNAEVSQADWLDYELTQAVEDRESKREAVAAANRNLTAAKLAEVHADQRVADLAVKLYRAKA